MTKVLHVLDTDAGVDDALALYLFGQQRTAHSAVITSYGNVSEEDVWENVQLCSKVYDYPGVIFRGCQQPISGQTANAAYVHGNDGLGGARAILQKQLKNRKSRTAYRGWDDFDTFCSGFDEIQWIALGPATNLSRALSSDSVGSRLSKITLMTGVFFDKGNVTDVAEFNAYCDPVALDSVLKTGRSLNIVSLDVCRKVQFRLNELEKIFSAIAGPTSNLLTLSHRSYCSNYLGWEGFLGCFPHDSVALLSHFHSDEFYYLQGDCACLVEPDEFGKTTISISSEGKHRVCFGGNLKFVREFIGSLGQK